MLEVEFKIGNWTRVLSNDKLQYIVHEGFEEVEGKDGNIRRKMSNPAYIGTLKQVRNHLINSYVRHGKKKTETQEELAKRIIKVSNYVDGTIPWIA